MKRVRNALLKNIAVRSVLFSFPFRLLLLNFKKNILFLLLWALLFGFITNVVGSKYGVPYLFLNPEYLDESGFFAYLILGFSCGGFIMAYNISSYVMNAFRFPFLATLNHPFWKYCLNNFLIPVLFLLVYCFKTAWFLGGEEFMSAGGVCVRISAFLAGATVFIGFSIIYFFRTNKDIYKMFGIRSESEIPKPSARKLKVFKDMGVRNPNLITESRDWYVEVYMSGPFRWKLVRAVKHYKTAMLRTVFRQNHKNAALFVAVTLLSLFVLGWFDDVPVLAIPAGASILLFCTMILMLLGFMYTLFRGWANFMMLGLFLLFNYSFTLDFFNSTNEIYGLNYSTRALYDTESLSRLASDRETVEQDKIKTLAILNKWKERMKQPGDTSKPVMIFLNTSGGGLRSALWTFYIMQLSDSLSSGNFFKHTSLICGSSGGMIGAAYYRELKNIGGENGNVNLNDPAYLNNISKDLLNPVAFSIATNDWFLPIRHVEVDGQMHNRDRAYAFERKLNENTSAILDVPLSYYTEPESSAKIPMMIFSPVIINDARKLVISAQDVSYLTAVPQVDSLSWNKLPNSVEFKRLFAEQDPGKTRMSSILRVNSAFPYIFPIAELPTEPVVEVMDAGLRDNYGIEMSLKFLYTFREWIKENTSGVVFLQVRDKKKLMPVTANKGKSLTQSLSKPLGTFYVNHFTVQDYHHEELLFYLKEWFGNKMEILDFELKTEENDNISLSWHLTHNEKQKVLRSISMDANKKNLRRLMELLR